MPVDRNVQKDIDSASEYYQPITRGQIITGWVLVGFCVCGALILSWSIFSVLYYTFTGESYDFT